MYIYLGIKCTSTSFYLKIEVDGPPVKEELNNTHLNPPFREDSIISSLEGRL